MSDTAARAWSYVYYLVNQPGKKVRENFARFLDEPNGESRRPRATSAEPGSPDVGCCT